MASTAVGCSVRAAGVWRRIERCTVRVSSTWKECQRIWVRNGGAWKVVWADDARALGNVAFSVSNFDFGSPFDVGAGWRILSEASGGARQTFDLPPDPFQSYSNNGNWLNYDLDRTYQVFFTLIQSGFDTQPSTGSWLTTAATRTLEARRESQGLVEAKMDVSFRRNEGTPGPTLRTDRVSFTLEAGQL